MALTHQPYLDGPPLGISLHQPQAVSPAGSPRTWLPVRWQLRCPRTRTTSLDMNSDDDELATQVYDKPSEFSGFPFGARPIPPVRPPSQRDAFAAESPATTEGQSGP